MRRHSGVCVSVGMFAVLAACDSSSKTQGVGTAGAPGVVSGTGATPIGGAPAGVAGTTVGAAGTVATPPTATAGTGAAGIGTGVAGQNSGASGSPAMAGGPAPGTAGAGAGTAGMPAPQPGGAFAIPPACGAATPNPMPGNACPGAPPPAIKLTMVASGLVAPTYAAQAPGDPTRIYVLEQRGTVRVIKDGQLAMAPALDLRDMSGSPVNNSEIVPGSYGEGGLLGMVFDPMFATTQRVWLSYTTAGPDFTVSEFKMSNPDTVDVTSAKELLSFKNYPFSAGQATNHVGSMLAFGPDGCMYVSRGEGGGENDSHMSGQTTEDDLASVLRIDAAKFPTAAPGNLAGHVWNYGFRNPWRFSFDRVTGDMYIGDVGQDVGTGFEEVNIEPRGVSGRNYGWSVTAGPSGGTAEMIKPVHSYAISQTQNSVIGGYVYRGSKIPGMVGRYIWADWTERKIKTLVYKGEMGGQPQACDLHDTNVMVDQKVRSFAEGLDGEVYVLAGGPPNPGLIGSASISQMGAIYRIDPQ